MNFQCVLLISLLWEELPLTVLIQSSSREKAEIFFFFNLKNLFLRGSKSSILPKLPCIFSIIHSTVL